MVSHETGNLGLHRHPGSIPGVGVNQLEHRAYFLRSIFPLFCSIMEEIYFKHFWHNLIFFF